MRDYISLMSVILAMVGVLMLVNGVNWMVCIATIVFAVVGFVYSDNGEDDGGN